MEIKKLVVLLALTVLIIVVAVYVPLPPSRLTLISASTINIEQYGGLEGNKLTGTYWSILLAVDYTDQVGLYTFDDAQAHSPVSSYYWQGKNVTVKNKITLEILPGQPYYERPMQLRSTMVVPSARQHWIGFGSAGRSDENIAEPLYSGHWETITSDWVLHTPIVVKVYVNNVCVGAADIDTIGVVDTNTISLGKEVSVKKSENAYLTITNLGALQTGYTFPIWSGVVWFNNQYFYLNSEKVQRAIHNPYPIGDGQTVATGALTDFMPPSAFEETYAWYWYGQRVDSDLFDWYWKDNGEPCPYHSLLLGYVFLNPAKSPGWERVSSGIFSDVLKPWGKPPKFPTDNKPSPDTLSLVEFLEQRALAQKPLMPSWEPNPNNIKFIQTDIQNGYLRVYLPWGSFVRLLNVRISAELADTVVWEPQVANIKIVDCPSDIGSIGERKTVSITLRQTSTVTSDGYVKLTPVTSGLYWSFQPPAFGTGPMPPDTSKTFTFDVVNLGQPTDTPFKFKVEVYNSLGQLTDSREVTGTLLARGGQGSVLVVWTIDKETRIYVSGIHVIVNYDTVSKDGWTSGGAVSFDFGGGTPFVTISTVETIEYKSATVTKQLSLGQNEVTIELERKGGGGVNWLWIIIAACIAITLIAVALTIYAKKRR